MIVVTDIGATKGDWRLLEDGRVSQFVSGGYNSSIDTINSLSIPGEIPYQEVKKVYFYGAGILDTTREKVAEKLKNAFPNATVEVASDLLGAARSLWGTEAGIVGILGTGSAVCEYDGNTITRKIPSLGYVLGDEGSGFHFGKTIIAHYLRGQLPKDLAGKFENEYGPLSEAEVLERAYRGGSANSYLSKFAEFVISNQADPYVYRLVTNGFNSFFDAYFENTSIRGNQKVRFTGSVAHLLSNLLLKVARDRSISIDLIAQKPIAGLTLYHQNHG